MMTEPSPSELIDSRIAELGDWRGEMLARIRTLIHEAVPQVIETWKWRGVPVWEHDGIICTGETYKAVVKLTFAKGAALDDPQQLFNASLEGNTRRAIDIHDGETLDAQAFKAPVRAAVAPNAALAVLTPQVTSPVSPMRPRRDHAQRARQQDHRQQACGDDGECGQSAFFQLIEGGQHEHRGRQRLEVERAQDQRRRQFLHAVDEHQQRRRNQCRPQQRQMHFPRKAAQGLRPSVRAAAATLGVTFCRPLSMAPKDTARKRAT